MGINTKGKPIKISSLRASKLSGYSLLCTRNQFNNRLCFEMNWDLVLYQRSENKPQELLVKTNFIFYLNDFLFLYVLLYGFVI